MLLPILYGASKREIYKKAKHEKAGEDLDNAQVANNTKQVEGNKGRNTPNTPKANAIPPIQLYIKIFISNILIRTE